MHQLVGLIRSPWMERIEQPSKQLRWFMCSYQGSPTYCICAQAVQHAALGDGFEGRAPQDRVHSLPQEVGVAELWRHIVSQLPQLPVVGVGHAWEANAEPERGTAEFWQTVGICTSVLSNTENSPQWLGRATQQQSRVCGIAKSCRVKQVTVKFRTRDKATSGLKSRKTTCAFVGCVNIFHQGVKQTWRFVCEKEELIQSCKCVRQTGYTGGRGDHLANTHFCLEKCRNKDY